MVLVTCELCKRDVEDSACWTVHDQRTHEKSFNCIDEKTCRKIRNDAFNKRIEEKKAGTGTTQLVLEYYNQVNEEDEDEYEEEEE